MRIFITGIMTLLIGLVQPVTANTFKTEKWLTKNGVQVIFYPAPEVPMLDVSLAFAAGSAYDGKHYGLSSLTSQLMNQGNAGQDASIVAEALAESGAQYGVEMNRDMVVFNLRTLTKKEAMARASTTFTKIINHPDFPDQAFIREKQQQLLAIKHSQESPEHVAQTRFFRSLYGQHPYAHPMNGTTKSIENINKNQVIEFYKRYYVANNAILVLVGALDSKTAHNLAEQLTTELPIGQHAPAIPKAPQLTQTQKVTVPYSSSQTVIRLGQIGIDHQDPNYFPLMVGNYILGGGLLVSRLAVEVRERQGLTYGIDSQFAPMPGKGAFIVSLSTKNKQTQQALDIIHHILNQYLQSGPSDEEIKAAKQYMIGSFPLSLSGNRSIATLLLRMAFYHLPENYLDTYTTRIATVSKEQIIQAFKQQLSLDKLLLVTVGKS